jgi:hypothetical protein
MDRVHGLISGSSQPKGLTVFTSVLFASSGWVNVLLWALTGRQFGFSADHSDDSVDDGKGEDAVGLSENFPPDHGLYDYDGRLPGGARP